MEKRKIAKSRYVLVLSVVVAVCLIGIFGTKFVNEPLQQTDSLTLTDSTVAESSVAQNPSKYYMDDSGKFVEVAKVSESVSEVNASSQSDPKIEDTPIYAYAGTDDKAMAWADNQKLKSYNKSFFGIKNETNDVYWKIDDSTLYLCSGNYSEKTGYEKDDNAPSGDNPYMPPWYDEINQIKTVNIQDEIHPIYTSSWFSKAHKIRDRYQIPIISKIVNLKNIKFDNAIDTSFMFTGLGYKGERLASDKVEIVGEWDSESTTGEEPEDTLDLSNVKNCTCMFSDSGINVGFIFGNEIRIRFGSNLEDAYAAFQGIDGNHTDGRTPSTTINFVDSEFSNLNRTKFMFNAAAKLENILLSNINTSQLSDAYGMFLACHNLKSLDLTGWSGTPKSSNDFNKMFAKCESMTKIMVSPGTDWSQSSSTNTTYANMFWGDDSLVGCDNTLYNIDNCSSEMARVDNGNTIVGYSSDTPISPAGYFSAYRVRAILNMDSKVLSFTSDNSVLSTDCVAFAVPSNSQSEDDVLWLHLIYKDDINSVDFSNVGLISNLESTAYWFANCSNFGKVETGQTPLKSFEKLDLSNIKSMNSMFEGCISLESLDLRSEKYSNVANTSMANLCKDCTNLVYVDLRMKDSIENFASSDVSNMFAGCTSLESVYVTDVWKLPTKGSDAFTNCSKLVGTDFQNYAYPQNNCEGSGGYNDVVAYKNGEENGFLTRWAWQYELPVVYTLNASGQGDGSEHLGFYWCNPDNEEQKYLGASHLAVKNTTYTIGQTSNVYEFVNNNIDANDLHPFYLEAISDDVAIGFKQWVNNSSGTIFDNIDYIATVGLRKYNISYLDQDGVTFSGQHENGYPTTHTYGISTTLDVPTKEGYDFKGWHKSSDCLDDSITSLGAEDVEADVTLYAKWELKTFDITYDANGGSPAIQNVTQTYGVDFSTPTQPTKDGFTFKGWYDENNTPIANPAILENIPANKTFYAHWNIIKYSVTFNYDNEVDEPQIKDQYFDANYNMPNPVSPTKSGYTFDYWYFTSGSKEVKVDGDTIVSSNTLPEDTGGARNIYAHWTPNEYYLTINYLCEGDSIAPQYKQLYTLRENYSVESPMVGGYKIQDDDQSVVSGTMEVDGVTVDVNYDKVTTDAPKLTFDAGEGGSFPSSNDENTDDNPFINFFKNLFTPQKDDVDNKTLNTLNESDDIKDSGILGTDENGDYIEISAKTTGLTAGSAATYPVYTSKDGGIAYSLIAINSTYSQFKPDHDIKFNKVGLKIASSGITIANQTIEIKLGAYQKDEADKYRWTATDKTLPKVFKTSTKEGVTLGEQTTDDGWQLFDINDFEYKTSDKNIVLGFTHSGGSNSSLKYEYFAPSTAGYYALYAADSSTSPGVGSQKQDPSVRLYYSSAKTTIDTYTKYGDGKVYSDDKCQTPTSIPIPTNSDTTKQFLGYYTQSGTQVTDSEGHIIGDVANICKSKAWIINAATTLVAHWGTNKNYHIDIISEHGQNVPSALDVSVGDSYGLSNPEDNTGWTFTGWIDGAGNAWAHGSDPVTDGATGNLPAADSSGYRVLTAQWERTQYSVTYNKRADEEGDVPAMQSYDIGTSVEIQNASLTKNGFVLDGWTDNIAGTGTVFHAGDYITITEDINLYAKWIEASGYTVIYMSNGGSEVANKACESFDEAGLIPTNQPVKRGYHLVGWYDNDSLTGNAITNTTKYSDIVGGDATQHVARLYAKWEANEYIIKADANGGDFEDGSTTQLTYEYNGNNLFIEGEDGFTQPTRGGFLFDGWYTDKDEGNQVKVINNENLTSVGCVIDNTSKNGTVYAHWVPSHTLTFDGDENIVNFTYNNQTYTKGESVVLANDTEVNFAVHVRESTNPKYRVKSVITDRGELKPQSNKTYNVVVNDDIHILAYSEEYEGKIVTFDAGDGKWAGGETQKEVEEVDGNYWNTPETLPTWDGSATPYFSYWYYMNDGNEVVITNSLPFNEDSLPEDWDNIVHAKYDTNLYVVFNANGGWWKNLVPVEYRVSQKEVQQTIGQKYSAPDNVPLSDIDDKLFKKWTLDKEGLNDFDLDSFVDAAHCPTVLYAQYDSPDIIKIKFNANDGLGGYDHYWDYPAGTHHFEREIIQVKGNEIVLPEMIATVGPPRTANNGQEIETDIGLLSWNSKQDQGGEDVSKTRFVDDSLLAELYDTSLGEYVCYAFYGKQSVHIIHINCVNDTGNSALDHACRLLIDNDERYSITPEKEYTYTLVDEPWEDKVYYNIYSENKSTATIGHASFQRWYVTSNIISSAVTDQGVVFSRFEIKSLNDNETLPWEGYIDDSITDLYITAHFTNVSTSDDVKTGTKAYWLYNGTANTTYTYTLSDGEVIVSEPQSFIFRFDNKYPEIYGSSVWKKNYCSIGSCPTRTTDVQSVDDWHYDTPNIKGTPGPKQYLDKIHKVVVMPSFINAPIYSLAYMFEGMSNVGSDGFIGLENIPVFNITSFKHMFKDAKYLPSLDLSSWDTRNVTDMTYMFGGAYVGDSETTLNLKNWNVSKVTSFDNMFDGCTKLAHIYTDASTNWNITTSGASSTDMFKGCTSLHNYNSTLATGLVHAWVQNENATSQSDAGYFECTDKFNMTFEANPPKWGSVNISLINQVPCDTEYTVNGATIVVNSRTVNATAVAGYKFVKWTCNGADLQNGTYKVKSSDKFVAVFERVDKFNLQELIQQYNSQKITNDIYTVSNNTNVASDLSQTNSEFVLEEDFITNVSNTVIGFFANLFSWE